MPIVNLPAFFDMAYTQQDGHLSPDGHLYNDQMFQVLNNIVTLLNGIATTVISGTDGNNTLVTINGLNPPSLTTVQIDTLVAATPLTTPLGTIWYNTDVNKLQVLVSVGGVPTVQTITSA